MHVGAAELLTQTVLELASPRRSDRCLESRAARRDEREIADKLDGVAGARVGAQAIERPQTRETFATVSAPSPLRTALPPSGSGKLLWHALGAKTVELINANVRVESVRDDLDTLVLDAQVLDDLIKEADHEKKGREAMAAKHPPDAVL